jgi:hypothetical protein
MTFHRLIRRVIVLIIAVALCTACGSRGKSDTPSAQAVRSGFGPGTSSSTPGATSSTQPGAANTPTPAKGVNPASGSASLQDPPTDALKTGNGPTYTDITSASIRGHSGTITFTMTYAAALPAAMPDAQTTYKTGFRVKVGDVAYVLTATASTSGWAMTVTKNGAPVSFPGTLQTKGSTLTIVSPSSFLGGVNSFSWTGFTAWDAETTPRSYSVDIVPNSGEAAFPQA